MRQVTRKRASLDKALATAQSEPMRLLVVQEFYGYFLEVREPAMGSSLLASIKDQFGPDGVAKIASMREVLDRVQQSYDAQARDYKAAAAKASQAAQLKNCQESLRRAQMDHNQKAITTLQAAIADLQAKMQSNDQ